MLNQVILRNAGWTIKKGDNMNENQLILNLAAGKLLPLDLKKNCFVIQLDTMFYAYDTPDIIEKRAYHWIEEPFTDQMRHCKENAFQFMENTTIPFDRICAYRFLEHVTFTQVEYFIYLISTCLEIGGQADIIVPDYNKLAKLLLEDNTQDPEFHSKNITLTTELLNEPSCPHASIWTKDRLHYFFCEVEKRFKMINMKDNFEFDGRDLYIRGQFERIK